MRSAFATGQHVRLDYASVCERCIVVTTDQKSGEPEKEPLATLSRYRKREGGYAGGIVFGAYMAVGLEGTLRVGETLETSD